MASGTSPLTRGTSAPAVPVPGTGIPGTLAPLASSLVGREAEIARATELLGRARLVTVTGVAGVGKTRLALRVADLVADGFRDGVHLAELSGVRDPKLLVHSLAARLAIAESEQRTQLDVLLGFIRERELLLILDTCEHLVGACAALADAILREAPGVSILATSRQPLDVPGEATMLLSPLPVPEPGSPLAGKADAVELFEQRAAAAVPGFSVTPENLADVIMLCRRLDGIPLAIELATVRLRALPLRQMAERIDDRLRLLTGGRRSGTPRHHTLRAAIEWSYSLCTPSEQTLWARLSVFASAFDTAAAVAVCADDELTPSAVTETIAGLVDKSVLVADAAGDTGTNTGANTGAGGDEPRATTYRMLDTIREFGAECLHLAGESEEESARSRYIAHYLGGAEHFERLPTTDQLGQYQWLRHEHQNLRAAFEYALGLPGNDSAAIGLATSLFVYWQISGLLREGEYWLDRAVERCPRRSVVRARVVGARGYLRVLLGDFANGRTDAEDAVAMAAAFGDAATLGRGYLALHRALAFCGNLAEAQQAARDAATSLASVGDTLGLAQLDLVDAMLRLQTGEPDRCMESAAQGLRRLPEDEIWCSAALIGMQSLGLFLRGDVAEAVTKARLQLELKTRLRDVGGTASALGILAFIAAGEQRYERTAWLFGASAPLWERAGRWYTGSPAFEALHKAAERIAQAGLGDDRYWEAHASGSATPLARIVRLALADADRLTETQAP
jgi:predicted ATPase